MVNDIVDSRTSVLQKPEIIFWGGFHDRGQGSPDLKIFSSASSIASNSLLFLYTLPNSSTLSAYSILHIGPSSAMVEKQLRVHVR